MVEQSMLTKTEEELLADAANEGWEEPRDVLSTLQSPNWDLSDYPYSLWCGVWESLIPESVLHRWEELSLEAKLVAYLIAARGVRLIPEPSDG